MREEPAATSNEVSPVVAFHADIWTKLLIALTLPSPLLDTVNVASRQSVSLFSDPNDTPP